MAKAFTRTMREFLDNLSDPSDLFTQITLETLKDDKRMIEKDIDRLQEKLFTEGLHEGEKIDLTDNLRYQTALDILIDYYGG